MTKANPIPKHQWTHIGDKVLVVRQCAHDGSSSHDFIWPKSGPVTCPDWEPHNRCGNGLHGWPWGLALGDGSCQNYDWLWLVVAVDPKDVVDVEDAQGKVKFKQGEVIFAGEWWKAMKITEEGRVAWIHHAAQGQSATSGDSSSAATSGYRSSAASTGDSSVAVCSGIGSRAQAGEYGAIALAWWNEKQQRSEMRCACVVNGKNGTLKPGVWYRLNARGKFVQDRERGKA